MATATATATRLAAPALEDFRTALERTLTEADTDEHLGPLLGATRLRMRFEFTDANLGLNLAAGDSGRNLSWSFGDPAWPPRLVLTMETATANRFLQGAESLPIAIARGHVRCRGESRAALQYLPATRLLAKPYLRVVERDFPDLLVA
jgi:hypothetical protein